MLETLHALVRPRGNERRKIKKNTEEEEAKEIRRRVGLGRERKMKRNRRIRR